MEAQIYELDTPFNFGKFAGSSLLEVLNLGQSRYLGRLIFSRDPRFVLSPLARMELERAGYFDNLYMSAPFDGGSIPLNMGKQDIVDFLIRRYEDYILNPSMYNQRINERVGEYNRQQREKERNATGSNTVSYSGKDEEDTPYEIGSSKDSDENPWRDILPDDEADVAYWNTE